MKRVLLAGLCAGVSLLATVSNGAALERVMVGGLEATRIVVAPPQTALARTIRDGLRQAISEAGTARERSEAQQLYYFYGSRYFEPLWLTQEDDGAITFSGPARNVVALYEKAHLEGLEPADYLTPDLDIDTARGDPEKLAALEQAFSASMLRYARDASSGRLDPGSVSGFIDVEPKQFDEKALLERLSAANDPAAILARKHPDHPEFLALRELLAAHYDGSVEKTEPIGDGKLIRPGMSDQRVPLLRERFDVAVPAGADPILYDTALVKAIEDFQREMGLNPDGVVGPATIAAINGMNGASRAAIIANMERWRWMPDDLGDFHVFVNIPEFRLEVRRNGRSMWDTRVIVGTTKNQTPIFSDEIRHVVTNPYWNVPFSILRDEIFPQVARNPNYIANQNMELLYQGRAIDPWMVDWSRATPSMFRVRQRPGSSNALGQVKFLFPNSHDVYLHDTNARYLFERSMRSLSHGCVRVQDPFGFAQALLEFEPNLTVAALEGTLGGRERWFSMERHVPVHLAYFTLRAGQDGAVRSYADLYGHDAAIISMLGLKE